VVANWAAGKQRGEIRMADIQATLGTAMEQVRVLLGDAIPLL
jgi:hypothetical protein